MADLLYLLELYIPNLGEILGVIGFFIFIFGVVSAFCGYRLFKILLSIIGFLVGAVIALALFPQSGSTESNVFLLWVFIGGAIGSVLAETFHKLGVFIVVGAMSAIIFLIITQNTTSSLVLGVICGIIGVFFEKYVIIVTTALSGGSLAATGIWFIRLSNGKAAGAQVWGLIIGICGIAFQLWSEKRRPVDTKEESSIWVDIAADGVISIVSALLSLFKRNPKENLHNLIYDRESNEVKSVLIKALLGFPIVIGIIFGCLFRSGLFGIGIITVLYILIMVYFVRKKRAELSPEGYVQRFTWEKWLNKVLDKNALIVFTPLFPGFFIFGLTLTYTDSGILLLLFTLLGIIGSYVVFFKALTDGKTKGEIDVPHPDVASKEPQTPPQPPNFYSDTDQKSRRCSNCGNILSYDAIFCSKCGSPVHVQKTVEEYVFCRECGAKLPSTARFCGNCGMAQNK